MVIPWRATLQSGADLPLVARQKARGSMRGSHHGKLPVGPPASAHIGVKGSMSTYPFGSEDDRLSFSSFIHELFRSPGPWSFSRLEVAIGT